MKLTTIAGVLCLGVAVFAQDVQFDYNRSANFNGYRTYQWVESKSQAGSQLMDQNIKRAVDAQLALKGLQRVETGGDLKVAYHVAIEKEKQFEGWNTGPRFFGNARVTSSTIEIGKLMVDVFDSAKNQLVWRGSAEKTLDIKKDPDKNFKNLEKAVAKLFKNYPPDNAKR